MYCMRYIQNPVYYHKFRHIKPYCGIFGIMRYSCIFRTCHIQNPGIFRTWDIFRTLQRHTLAYSERCVTLAYWQPCHIQNFAIFRILAYLGLEAYSIMMVIIKLTFLSFTLILHTFQRNLKRHICFLTTRTSISMLD